MSRVLKLAAAGLFVLHAGAMAATPVFVDWTSVDVSNSLALGKLGDIDVTLQGGDIVAGVINGSSATFGNSSYFSPALGSSDEVEIRGSRPSVLSYTLSFSAPVQDPVFHIASLASTMTFAGLSPQKVSGEAGFVVAGTDITGAFVDTNPAGGTDRNGTIVLQGTFSSISFSTHALGDYKNDIDGIQMQLGASPVPEPSTGVMLSLALATAMLLRRVRVFRSV